MSQEPKKQKIKNTIQEWGLNTILFTMFLRAVELDKIKLEPSIFLKSVSGEANEISKELWGKVVESSESTELSEVLTKFIQNIMDWCANLRKDSKDSQL